MSETWRVGRSLGRTLYIQVGDQPSKDDQCIGMLDTAALAERVVAAVNEVERLRAVKRHLSKRISIGQEGWNEIHREAEQLRAERDALKATVKNVKALRDIWNLLPGLREEADALDAALDAPETTEDAEEAKSSE